MQLQTQHFRKKEMISRLDFLKEARGIGIFTAMPGIGKDDYESQLRLSELLSTNPCGRALLKQYS